MSRREPELRMERDVTGDYADPRDAASLLGGTRYYLDEIEITREQATAWLDRYGYATGELP